MKIFHFQNHVIIQTFYNYHYRVNTGSNYFIFNNYIINIYKHINQDPGIRSLNPQYRGSANLELTENYLHFYIHKRFVNINKRVVPKIHK